MLHLQQSGIIILWTTSLCFVSDSNAQTDRYITVPALGRFSEIGFLYNERIDRIIDASVFRHAIPSDSIIEYQSPTTTSESTTENSFEQLVQLFNIPLDTAVNILAGISKPKGAARILNPNQKNVATSPTGTLLVRHETTAQRLQVCYDGLQASYNLYLLNHRDATHIVTGVTWGAQVAVTIVGSPPTDTDINTEEINDQLNTEIQKLEGRHPLAEDESSNFTISIEADVTLSSQMVPQSIKEVQQFLLDFPKQIKSINGGKGIPLEFRLTPISFIREFLKEPKKHQNMAYKVPDLILRKFTRIFSNILNIEQRINSVGKQFSSQPSCVTPQTTQKFQDFQSNFSDSKSALKDALKVSLVQVRLGNQSAVALGDLAEQYERGNYSLKSTRSKLTEFDVALAKISFCKTINMEDAQNKIEYFSLAQNLIPRISQESEKIVFILFIKSEWAQNDAVKFTENLSAFLGLNTSSEVALRCIVDCDFEEQPFCSNLTNTAVHTYENGILTSTDLKQKVRQEESDLRKQIEDLQNATAAIHIGQERLEEQCQENSRKILEQDERAMRVNNTLGDYRAEILQTVNQTVEMLNDRLTTAFQHSNETYQHCQRQMDNLHVANTLFGRRVDENAENIREQQLLHNGLQVLSSNNTQNIQNLEQTCEAKHSCSPNKCLNGGGCVEVDGQSNFECICQHGFEGSKCERQKNICESSPCLNNGVCHSGFNSFSCACALGFNGPTCGVPNEKCSPNKTVCENGGKCITEVYGFTCACPLPWAGTKCQIKLDPCASSNTCQNGATCHPGADFLSSYCMCRSGYTGEFCEQDIDECELNIFTCRNGATCLNTKGSYTCSCAEYYIGNNCETFSDCLRNNDCTNGATCLDEIGNGNQNSHGCLCPDGYAGPTCGCDLRSSGNSTIDAPLRVITVTECGGLIQIPDLPATSSFLLDYKSNVAGTKDEQCLWTLDSTKDGNNYDLKVRVTLLCDEFRNSTVNMLSSLGWQWTGPGFKLSQHTFSNQSSRYEPGQWDHELFLHYMSTNTNARQSGFILLVDVLEVRDFYFGSTSVSRASAESHAFGPYRTRYVFSMTVFPPQTNFTLTVDYLESSKTGPCQGDDVLEIYQINSVDSSNATAKLCGNITSPISYASTNPIIILQFTRHSTTGRGFSLSWK